MHGAPQQEKNRPLEGDVTFHPKGFLAFAAFLAVFMLALDTGLGVRAIAACVVIELLLWSGAAGLGRGREADRA